jgi:glycosyltransferase involved in cell wall biosynthesis
MQIPDKKITVLRNGVDLEMFTPPSDKEELRKNLGISGTTILSVGYLIERKGHHLIIEALTKLPDVRLLIAGEGAEHDNLLALVRRERLDKRVSFLGNVPHQRLKDYYGAVDMLVLASSREGWANVLLESMACGTPVVATKVWGTPEVVSCPEAGVLVDRNAYAISEGIKKIIEYKPDCKLTRNYAEKFDWTETSNGQMRVFQEVVR